MYFLMSYKIRPGKRDEGVERFLKTGAPPPKGVKMVSRWHNLAGQSGLTIGETDDPLTVQEWCMQWNDVLEFDVQNVFPDEQAGQLMAKVYAK